MFTEQDCFATIPPFPFYRGNQEDFNIVQDMDDVMFGRPELLFRCKFRPRTTFGEEESSDEGDEVFELPLIFFRRLSEPTFHHATHFSAIAESYNFMSLDPQRPMLDPILHVGFCANVLCRAPLIPCFLGGSEQPTIPHGMRQLKATQFPFGRADSRKDKGDGSKLYEVNMWLWEFGRGKQRTRTVAEEELQREIILERSRREAWKSRKRQRLRRTEKE